MFKKINFLFIVCFGVIEASMLIGAGGFDVKKIEQRYMSQDTNSSYSFVNITEVLEKQSPNVNSVTMWITPWWKEDWYGIEQIQKEIIDKGYTPVFIFYWFADEISVDYIAKHKEQYFKDLKRFVAFMKQLKGKKIVVLNPEYNMFGVEKWDGMNDIFLESYQMIREDKEAEVGPCVGDFGNYSFVDEPQEWKLFAPSIARAFESADFIAFQEMRGLTRNSKADMLRTPQRALHLAKYLHKTYHKPTMLAYSAISSYGKEGELIQAKVYKGFAKLLPQMQEEAGLFYFGTFHYFDYPHHVGYFNEAEEYFGVLTKEGKRKLSHTYFNTLK